MNTGERERPAPERVCVPPSPWREHVEYRRSVMCRNSKRCDCLAIEWVMRGGTMACGCCTRCGEVWSTALTMKDMADVESAVDSRVQELEAPVNRIVGELAALLDAARQRSGGES